MHLKFSYVAALLLGAAQPAFCAHNFEQTLADFDAIDNAARDFGDAIDNYHGGLAGAIAVGNKARTAQMVTDNARKNLDASNEPFTDAEAKDSMDRYYRTAPVVLDNVHKVAEKAPEFREAGVESIAHGMVTHMRDTAGALRVAYRKKLPPGDENRMASSDEKLNVAFQEAATALSA